MNQTSQPARGMRALTGLRQHRGADQRGIFAIGLVVGLLIGLALALAVALYVTKVPIPFVNKVPQRSADQDAAEAEKNKNWDPNSPLYGKTPVQPITPAASAASAPTASPASASNNGLPTPALTGNVPAANSTLPGRDPAAILEDRPVAPARAPASSAASADRAPALAPVVTATPVPTGNEPFSYFVQAGAFGHPEEAEAQRAKLAILGLEARVTEREQGSRTVYRVRVGPFDHKSDADAAKDRLSGAGVESALVRVQH